MGPFHREQESSTVILVTIKKAALLGGLIICLVTVSGLIVHSVDVRSASSHVAIPTTTSMTSTTSTTVWSSAYQPTPPVSYASSAYSGSVDLGSLFKTPPRVSITCPLASIASTSTLPVTFEHQDQPGSTPITTWHIDYGDGHSYDASSVDGVYDHVYSTPGFWTVRVTVTDQNGLTDQSSCVVGWERLGSVLIPGTPSGGGYTSGGCYTNVDLQCIPRPDYSGGGITCADGTTSHATHTQGACSYHGGIGG